MIKQLTRRSAATPKAEAGQPKEAQREINEQIGRELRAMFEGVVAEPVPERFRQLLEELERKTSKG